MCCTTTDAAPCAAPETERPSDWITLAAASRVSGLHETTLLRMALAGDFRHRVRGRRTPFSAEDVRRAAG
jgi:hypothetical protein